MKRITYTLIAIIVVAILLSAIILWPLFIRLVGILILVAVTTWLVLKIRDTFWPDKK